MALQKQIDDNKGYSADYHKIIAYAYDAASNSASISVALYKDMTARQNDAEPVEHKSYSFPSSGEPSSREFCYNLLKTLDEYSSAQDC